MTLRHVSAISAILFGMLLGYVVIGQGLHAGYVSFGERPLVALLTLVGGVAVSYGASTWWVFVAMVLAVLWQLQFPLVFSISVETAPGVYQYSVWSALLLLLRALSIFAVMTSLFADERGHRFAVLVRESLLSRGNS